MLTQLTERIWFYPYEDERDRPNLFYIHGNRWSLAVDSGHSADHTRDFYRALTDNGLPLPELTILTHWHWDHTFGMHAVHGLTLANERTNQYLDSFRQRLEKEGPGFFFALDESVRKEYENDKPVIVTPADLAFQGEMSLDPGNCPIRIFQAESPHTDDTTLIHIPDEKVLIMGDSICGEFPEWTKDPVKAVALADTVRRMNPEICLTGHWDPLSSDIIIQDLLTETK